jgi:hypothetical protein
LINTEVRLFYARMLTRISMMFNVRPTKDWPWLDAGLQDNPPGFRMDKNGEVRRDFSLGPDAVWTLAASSRQPAPPPPAQPTERAPPPPAASPSSRPQGDPPPALQRFWDREPRTLSPGTPGLPVLPPWLQDRSILGLPPGVLEAPPQAPEERAPQNPYLPPELFYPFLQPRWRDG